MNNIHHTEANNQSLSTAIHKQQYIMRNYANSDVQN